MTTIQIIRKRGGEAEPRTDSDRASRRTVYTFPSAHQAHEAYHDILEQRRVEMWCIDNRLTVFR